MNLRQVELKFKKNQKFATIGATSCWHIGNPQCREDKIVEMLQRWAKYKTPWINLGDTVDGIVPLDKRYHCETNELSALAQIQRVSELTKIAKKTMIGAIIGNHDDTLSKYLGCTIKHMLHGVYDHSEAESKWLGASAMIDFKCPSGTCRGLFAHSKISAGGNTSDPDRDYLNKQIRIRRALQYFEADLKIVGHGHTSIVAPPVDMKKLSIVKGKEAMVNIPLRPEWCAMCPSMFASYGNKTYPSYAEMAMYSPQDIGYLEIDIDRSGKVVNIREMLVD